MQRVKYAALYTMYEIKKSHGKNAAALLTNPLNSQLGTNVRHVRIGKK